VVVESVAVQSNGRVNWDECVRRGEEPMGEREPESTRNPFHCFP